MKNASLGLYINEYFNEHHLVIDTVHLAIDDHYTPQGKIDQLLELENLDMKNLDIHLKKVL